VNIIEAKYLAALAISIYILFGLPQTINWMIRHSDWLESHRTHE
jgi:hypothetical protein